MGPVSDNGGPIQYADNGFGRTATDGTYGSPDDANPDSGFYIPDSGGDMSGAQRDPLVIDLSGKGLNLTPRSATSPYFDFTGSGFAHNAGWIAAGTGFLALAGADGLVHDGTQLFGTGAQSGFDALRALDSNGDGVIDARDAAFDKLVVWQDVSGDGVCRPGEVSTLAQLGVTSISLHTSTVFQTVGNATVIGTALATMADGSTREVAEANLSISATYTRYVGNYTLNQDVFSLPELKGYGSLPSLSISMSQDGQLKTLVQQLVQVNPSSTAAFDAAMRAVLYRWAGVDGTTPASGGAFDGQELGFLRKLLGNDTSFGWWGESKTPWFIGQSNLLQKAWDEAYAGLKARVLVQLPGSPFAASFFVDPSTDLLVPIGRLTAVIAGLGTQAPADAAAQVGYWSNALLLVSTSVADLAQYAAPNTGALTSSLQAVVPTLFSPEVVAAAAAGTLSFVAGMALSGGLAGTPGADLVKVEQPNAVVTGLGGGDEFIVTAGLGTTEINEADNSPAAHNVLLLDGIAPSQVAVSGDAAGNIVLTLPDGSTVKLDSMLAPPGSGYQQAEGHDGVGLGASTRYGVQEVRFGEGTVWTAAQVVQAELSATRNAAATLYGTNGADVLDGQGVKHLLQGNGGGDTFVFKAGYGALKVKEADSSSTPANVLRLGAGIRPDRVTVTGNAAGDVLLTIGADGDAIKLDGMLASRSNGVQQVRFDDGTVWTAKQVLALADTGSAGNTSLVDLTGGATLDPAGYAYLVTSRGGGNAVLFNVGYGSVEVSQRSASPQDNNVLQFGAGIDSSQVVVTGDANGSVVLTVGSNGDRVQLDNMLLGSTNGVQTVKFADGTVWGAKQIIAQIPGGANPDIGYFQAFTLGKGSGPVATAVSGTGEVVLGAGIQAGDAYLQTDAAGSLIVRLHSSPGDSLTVGNAIYDDWNGAHSRITQLTYADGTAMELGKGLTFTWAGDGSGTASLTGSNDGANVFDFAPGTKVAAGSSQTANTYVFHKGDGQVRIVPGGGSNTVLLAAGIAASDVALQADAAGDLTVRLLDTGDTLTVQRDLAQGWWGMQSKVGQIGFGTDAGVQQGGSYWTQGQTLGFTWVGSGDGATLVGSGYGSNTFIFGPGSTHVVAGNDSQGGSNSNTFIFSKGNGHATVDMNGGVGTIQLGTDIPSGDVVLQADAAGGLTLSLRDDPLDSLTVTGNFSQQNWGVQSQIGSITFSDGTSSHFKQSYWSQAQDVPLTWIGSATAKALVGSNFGSNTFDLGAGGDQVTFGNNSQGGSGRNTVVFDRGDGAAVVTLNGGTGTLQIAADIQSSDVLLQANDAGDLTLSLRGNTADGITIKGDLSGQWWGVQSQISAFTFGDGTTLAFNQSYWDANKPMTFTQVGTASNTALTGSNWGANTFELGAGGDRVTFGNGSKGGSNSNTVLFGLGDGRAMVNVNGGVGTVKFGAGIVRDDLTFQAEDATGSLTVLDRSTGDSIVLKNDLGRSWWGGPTSRVGQLAFDDGSTFQLGQQYYGDNSLLTFTWTGMAANTTLLGSNFGNNVFQLGVDGDAATGGQYGNTYLYDRGNGAAAITLNGTTTFRLGAGIGKADLTFQADDATGDLTILDGAAGDSIVLKSDLGRSWWGGPTSKAGQLTFSDGSTFQLGQQYYGDNSLLTFTTTATAANKALVGSNYGNNAFYMATGGSAVGGRYDNTFHLAGSPTVTGGQGNNVYDYDKGEGAATILPNGTGTIQLGAGVARGDVTLQADDVTGDLTILDGSMSDLIVLKGDLARTWWGGPASKVGQLAFSDGSTIQLGQQYYGDSSQLAFTWQGTAANTVLTGSGWGSNTFVLGAGGDQVIFGNGNKGGSSSNTVVFGRGDGQATVNPNGSSGVVQLGAGITQSDIVFGTDGNNDLSLTLRDTGDSLVVAGGVTASGVLVQGITFADGTTLDASQIRVLARTTTQMGTTGSDALSGAGDAVIFDGQGAPTGAQDHEQGRSGDDAFVFKAGYGQLEVDEDVGWWANSRAVLRLGTGITAAQVTATSDSSGNLYLSDGTPGDQVRIDGLMNYGYGGYTRYGVAQVQFADGTTLNRRQLTALATTGTTGADALYGTTDADTFDGRGATAGSQDLAQGNGGADAFVFNVGYGRLEVSEDAGFWNDSTATLRLGAGITAANLGVSRDADGNVFLTDGTVGDQVKLDAMLASNWAGHTEYGVAQVQFADGATLTRQQIVDLTTTGTANADLLYGTAGADAFDGKGAPAGLQDHVQGNGGTDSFVFKAGYGKLEISEDAGFWNDSTATLNFGAGITMANLGVSRNQDGDLLLTDGVAGDQVKLDAMLASNWAGHTEYGVAQVQLADGTVLTRQQFVDLTTKGTSGADTLYGTASADAFDGNGAPVGSQDYVQGNGGGDSFAFRVGYGQLEINEDAGFWNDSTATLRFGPGITMANLGVTRDMDGNVFLTDGTSGDQVRIDAMLTSNWAGHTARGVAQVELADGTVLSRQQIVDLTTGGTTGAETLYGTASADTLDGKGAPAGSQDTVQGNGGADTFVFNAGYGRLEINEDAGLWSDSTATLRLGAGITTANLDVSRDADGNLYLADGTAGDRVKLDWMLTTNWAGHTQYGVAQVQLADGTVLTRQQFVGMTTTGTAGAETLYGTTSADTLDGKGAPAGSQDTVQGNGGADTFVFNAGYGRLEINEDAGFWNNSVATLKLGAGITAADLSVSRNADGNVYLTDGVAGDQIKLDLMLTSNWSGAAPWGVGQVQLADGTVLTRQQLVDLTTAGTSGADVLTGGSGADTFDGQGAPIGLQDTEQGNGGADTFVFNKGYGHLDVNEDVGFWNSSAAVLQVGMGITAADVSATKDGSSNVFLADGVTGDQIEIDGLMGGGWYGTEFGVAQMQFADGTTLTRQQLMALTNIGTAAADTLTSYSAANTFDGKGAPAGSQDTEQGQEGADTFIYNPGYGHLEINEDVGFWNSSIATLQVGKGLTAANLSATRDGAGNVFLTDGVAGDRIEIDSLMGGGWYGTEFGVAQMQFADGTTLTRQQLMALTNIGTAAADTLTGYSISNTFDGMGAPAGSQDTEQGQGGADTFIYNPGYGHLEINEDAGFWNSSAAVLQIGPGVTAADVSATKDSSGNVFLADGRTGDQVEIDGLTGGGWYGTEFGVAQVQFADGTAWTRGQITFLAGTGTSGADTITGTSGNNVFDGRGGGDVVMGGGGSDTYLFRQGYGMLTLDNSSGGGQAQGEVDFGQGITEQNLWFSRSGNDLVASVLGSADTVDVKGWFGSDASAQVFAFRGYDGLRLDSQMGQVTAAMASFAASTPGFNPATATAMPADPALRSALAAAWHG